jgi:hypothetical protein
MDNTQLPAEVEPSNDLESKIFNVLLHHSHANRTTAAKELAQLFETEYASKLHEEQQEKKELQIKLTVAEAACSILNDQVNEARTLRSRTTT